MNTQANEKEEQHQRQEEDQLGAQSSNQEEQALEEECQDASSSSPAAEGHSVTATITVPENTETAHNDPTNAQQPRRRRRRRQKQENQELPLASPSVNSHSSLRPSIRRNRAAAARTSRQAAQRESKLQEVQRHLSGSQPTSESSPSTPPKPSIPLMVAATTTTTVGDGVNEMTTVDEEEDQEEKQADHIVPIQQQQEDEFASRILSLRKKQPVISNDNNGNNKNSQGQKTHDKRISVDIEVSANEANPNRFVDITIQGSELQEELLTIILMTLNLEKWKVLQVVRKSNELDLNEDSNKIEECKQEEREEENAKDPGTGDSSLAVSRLCITVELPTRVRSVSEGENENNTQSSDKLRRLLLSACDDFVAPNRSSRALVTAFENSIERTGCQRVPSAGLISLVGPQSSLVESTDNDAALMTASLPPNVASNITGSDQNGEARSSTALPQISKHPTQVGRDSTGRTTRYSSNGGDQTPGAFSTPGRAFGAPVRVSRARNSSSNTTSRTETRRRSSVHSRLRSARQWFTSRMLGHNDTDEGADNENGLMPIAAEVVGESEQDMEETVRRKLVLEAAPASVVSLDTNEVTEARKQRKYLVLVSLLALLLVGTVIGMGIGFSGKEEREEEEEEDLLDSMVPTIAPISFIPSSSPTETPIPTLETILDRGELLCDVNTRFSIGELEKRLCEGLAAAIFGNSTNRVRFFSSRPMERFQVLGNRQVDVLLRTTQRSLSRTIHDRSTGIGYAFSSPYFYDGLVFGGMPEYVECANRLDSFFGICNQLSICVLRLSAQREFLEHHFPPTNIVSVRSYENVFEEKQCNVIAHESSQLAESLDEAYGSLTEPFQISSNLFSKGPLSMVTRPDDNEWTSFVEIFLQGLFEAERRNITKATASTFPSIPYAGPNYTRMVAQSVASIGNFGEVYNDTIGSIIPRVGLNRLRMDCDQDGGLIFGFYFGQQPVNIDILEAGTKTGEIIQSGKLRCAVPNGESAISNFSMELCMAISAGIFNHAGNQFEASTFGPASSSVFDRLLNDEVDVVVGAAASVIPMLNDTLSDYFISLPFFFNTNDSGSIDSYVFATNSYDHYWSMLVQLIVNTLILADEDVITQARIASLSNTSVDVFGMSYDSIARSTLLAVGNYGEIFERINATRSGCNRLNRVPHGPQQFPFLFHGL